MKKIVIGVGVVIVIVFVGVLILPKFSHAPQDVACTMEAKLCPDGSSVGRVPPSCEFAKCPGEGANDLSKTFTDPLTGATFEYPDHLLTSFIAAQEWPPKMEVRSGSFSCKEGGSEIQSSGKTAKRMVDGRTYCVTTESEGAAGSIYTTYAYTTSKDGKLVTFTLTLRAVQCANYDEPKKSDCEKERETFDLDGVINRIAMSLKLN